MRKQFCLKRFEECSACADMSCSSLSLTLSEVAAIPKLRMVWWFVHAITCAMAVGSCTVAEARWSIAFRCFNLRTGENVEGDFTMKQQAGGWRTLQLDFFKIILWHDCVECSYSVQISCPGVPSSFVPRRTTNPGRARFELIKSCWEKMRQVLFSWCEFMWWFQLEQVEVEIEVPAETMESVAIEVSWSHLVLESYCKRRGSHTRLMWFWHGKKTMQQTAEIHSSWDTSSWGTLTGWSAKSASMALWHSQQGPTVNSNICPMLAYLHVL